MQQYLHDLRSPCLVRRTEEPALRGFRADASVPKPLPRAEAGRSFPLAAVPRTQPPTACRPQPARLCTSQVGVWALLLLKDTTPAPHLRRQHLCIVSQESGVHVALHPQR